MDKYEKKMPTSNMKHGRYLEGGRGGGQGKSSNVWGLIFPYRNPMGRGTNFFASTPPPSPLNASAKLSQKITLDIFGMKYCDHFKL